MSSKFSKLLVLPLFLALAWWLFPINVNTSHNWGGDFAQYISQAKNIASGEPSSTSNFIRNPDYYLIGPREYPNGLPVLLSIAYTISGNDIASFLSLISAFFIIYFLLSYLLIKKETKSVWLSLLLSSFLITHPSLIEFKSQILSDLPFSAFFLASILLLKISKEGRIRKKVYLILFAGLLAGFSISIRSMGLVVILAYLLHTIFSKESLRNKLIEFTIFTSSAFTALLAVQLLFPSESSGDYLQIFNDGTPLGNILSNTEIYTRLLRDIAPVYHPNAGLLGILISGFLFVFSLIGIYSDARKDRSLIFWVVAVYWLVASTYSANMFWRFYIPILPFILLYSKRGLSLLCAKFPEIKKWGTAIFLLAIVMNAIHANRVRNSNKIIDGPQSEESLEAFQFLKNNCAENEVVNFVKPRVLALYTPCKTISNHPNNHEFDLDELWSKYNVKWLVEQENLANPVLEDYISINKEILDLAFENKKFKIYRLRD